MWNQNKVFLYFGSNAWTGGNGEISMNLNDQCRLYTCIFKFKFIFKTVPRKRGKEGRKEGRKSKRKDCNGEV